MKYCAALVFCMAILTAQVSFAQDVAGSADHPLVTRFPGSVITWYETQNYEPYSIAIGPVTGYRSIDEWLDVAGRVTRINYTLQGERGFYEVYANYLNAAKRAGFEVLAEGFDKQSSVRGAVGQRGFMGVHYGKNVTPPGASTLLQGSATSGGSGYFAAKLNRPQGTVFLVVGVTQYKQDEIVALVDIIEQKVMEDNLVNVDADAMSKDIDLYGKVALYGIYFDHDKATVKPESEPALAEIAKLLKKRPNLNLYVVGHTDLVGSLEYNINLSRQRAEAVVAALTKSHGIAAARLIPQGVGPLVPVMSNGDDAGRAKNRRVELVER